MSYKRIIYLILGVACFVSCTKDFDFQAAFYIEEKMPVVVFQSDVVSVRYNIVSTATIDSVSLSRHTDIVSDIFFNPEDKSGTMIFKANNPFNGIVDLTLTAYSSGYCKQTAVHLKYASLSADVTSTQYVAAKGGKLAYNIVSNVPYSISASEEFTSATIQQSGNLVTLTFDSNTTGSFLEGALIVSEDKGRINPLKLPIIQECISDGAESDKAVLAKIYSSLDGKNWQERGYEGYKMYSYWCTDEPVSKWLGVTLNSKGRVVALSLNWNKTISGILPDAIGDLPYLKMLEISGCDLYGPIPSGLSRLRKLQLLDFSSNRLSGFLSDIDLTETLPSVTLLSLYDNLLSGGVPEWLSCVRNSEGSTLWIYDNHFSGHIPEKVSSLSLWSREVQDGSTMTAGEKNCLQKDSYALWNGVRPDNTIWVSDHWEWNK